MMMTSFAKNDKSGRTVAQLWDEYKTTVEKDRPADGLKVLDQIKKKSLDADLYRDYFDACCKYYETRCQRNWKDRQEAMDDLRKEIRDLDVPVVTFAARYYLGLSSMELRQFADTHRDALMAGNHPELFKDESPVNYKGCPLMDMGLDNDYDRVLWVTAMQYGAFDAAKEHFAGRYPMDALLELWKVEQTYWNGDGKKAALEEYVRRHDGKFVSLYARESLLGMQFNELRRQEAGQDKYLILRDNCKTFIKDRDSYRGKEKQALRNCTEAGDLIRTLESTNVSVKVADNVATVVFTNTPQAELTILNGKETVWKTDVVNPECSFYVNDTVQVRMPDINDGEYKLLCESKTGKAQTDYPRYSLFTVYKMDADGHWAYVTDTRTGKPISGYEKGFKLLEDQDATSFQGSMVENGRLRLSPSVNLYKTPRVPNKYVKQLHGEIFCDRRALTPDETVNFTLVCFYADETFKSIAAGESVTVTLRNAEWKEIDSQTLTTDEWGQASGSFVLKRQARNGNYTISAGGLCSVTVHVDDFVLPTFDVVFDKDEKTYYAGDEILFSGTLKSFSGHSLRDAKVRYSIARYGDTVSDGDVTIDDNGRFSIPYASSESDGYCNFRLNLTVQDQTGETLDFHKGIYLMGKGLKPSEPEDEKDKGPWWFEKVEGNDIALNIGSKLGPTWAVVEVYGQDLKVKVKKMVYLDAAHIEETVRFPYRDEYGEAVYVNAFFVHDNQNHSWSGNIYRPLKPVEILPLSFSKFQDKSLPGRTCTFVLKTDPGTVCAIAVFNESGEKIMPNVWNKIQTRFTRPFSIPFQSSYWYPVIYANMENAMAGASTKSSARFKAAASNALVLSDNLVVEESMDAAPAAEEAAPDVSIRENFAQTLAWAPQVVADANGEVRFSFEAADNLSTFVVQVLAHDKKMRNAVTRKEMIVTMPVTVNLMEPQYLYQGDKYVAMAGLSNSTGKAVSGTVSVCGVRKHVSIPANGSIRYSAEVDVPENASEFELTATFVADRTEDGSDGVRVRIPVFPARQTLTEAHSALLLSGQDKDSLIAALRSQFVNIAGSDAAVREISILDMVKEALPKTFTPRGKDVLSQSESLCGALIAESLGSAGLDAGAKEELVKNILACRNDDGGFAWFAGGTSSMIVTAVMLQRFQLCGGLFAEQTESAVRYLDKMYFTGEKQPYWCGWISMEQYLLVRSMYTDIKCKESIPFKWRREAKKYLAPRKERGNGWIFFTARRALTLSNFIESGNVTSRRLRNSLADDVESLSQYAVGHPHGGRYFPNAVMPWRGLMETELEAHNVLCSLMDRYGHKDISEGVRLWMMIQKETQQWQYDPAFVLAIKNILQGTKETLDSKVIALSGSFEKPFSEVREAGNGMSIKRTYLKIDGKESIALGDGDVLNVGDRIIARYEVNNEENRSFVVMSVPRYASLRPVKQLSGFVWSGWGAYRNVLGDRSEYWYESFSEGRNVIEEEFFVTQQGTFQTPAAGIECRYANHYRANSAAEPVLTSVSQ